jgi:hypothetical protein
MGVFRMKQNPQNDEIRWQVIKAMLEQFPTLKERIRTYLKQQEITQ